MRALVISAMSSAISCILVKDGLEARGEHMAPQAHINSQQAGKNGGQHLLPGTARRSTRSSPRPSFLSSRLLAAAQSSKVCAEW